MTPRLLPQPISPEPAPVPPGQRLRWLARMVRALALLGGLVLVIAPWWFGLHDAWLTAELPLLAAQLLPLDDRARAQGLLAMLPVLAAAGLVLWRVWRLFGHLAAGEVFSPAALRQFRGFAQAVLALAVIAPLARTLLVAVLTWHRPPGQRLLVLSFNSTDFFALLIALVLAALALVMQQASALAEENRGFI